MQSKIAFLPQMNNFNQMFVAKLCHIIVAPSPFVHRGSGNIYDITWRYFGNNLSQHDGSSLKWTVRSGKNGRCKGDGLGVKWAIPKAQTRRFSDNKVDSPKEWEWTI